MMQAAIIFILLAAVLVVVVCVVLRVNPFSGIFSRPMPCGCDRNGVDFYYTPSGRTVITCSCGKVYIYE
jgi:hypothetical protein